MTLRLRPGLSPAAVSAESERLSRLAWFFASGPRRAEDYLDFCLHQPGFGYYARRPRLGARGDFATAATLGDGLGQALVRWIERHAPARGPVAMIEIGAGDGSLAHQIRQRLPRSLKRRLSLHLVDSSPVLRELQRQRLGRAVEQHEHPRAALARCGGAALIYSNELVDAFPPAVLQWNGRGWDEVGLAGRIDAGLLQLSEVPLACPVERLEQLDSVALIPAAWPGGRPPEHQRIEIAARYRDWLLDWLPAWRRGRMLTIDYGDVFTRLYPRRPRGTLRGYFHHQRIEGPQVWSRPGQQDLTFDVNFTDLHLWQRHAGLAESAPQPLAAWASRLGLALDPADPVALAGEAFQVSDCRRG